MNEHIYSTEDLSVLFNVGKSTIKRWTDEGKLHCFRTPGGHRKFTVSDVQDFVEKFNYEIATPNELSRHTSTNGTTAAISNDELFHEKKNRICSAAVQGNKADVAQCITDLYHNSIALSSIFDNVLLPALQFLNDRSRSGNISTVELQIARTTIFSALVQFENSVDRPNYTGKEVYCITTDNGMNQIELKALELLLESNGIKVFNLGNALSMFSARDLIEKCRPDDVFVVASYTPVDDHFNEQFTTLKKGVDSYGGTLTATCFSTDSGIVSFLMKESDSIEKSYSDVVRHLSPSPMKSDEPSSLKAVHQ